MASGLRATSLGTAEANPESFLRQYENPLLIDEAQITPAIFRALKLIVDERRANDKTGANGRFLLTGATNVMALPKLSDAPGGQNAGADTVPTVSL